MGFYDRCANKAKHSDSFYVAASPSLQSCACWRRYWHPVVTVFGAAFGQVQQVNNQQLGKVCGLIKSA